jgi:cysteine synthase A
MGYEDVDRSSSSDRNWCNHAISLVEADANRSADTHLLILPLPESWGIQLYLKDESTHPTGSLKHRLARSLFLYALSNGWMNKDTTVVEASSGSTAVSEAYFARLLGLSFIAVMPRATSKEKCLLIEQFGGECHFVDKPSEMYAEAKRIAREAGGHYMDQFTFSERATDWRGNNNIAESIFEQLSREPNPTPSWIVVGAGTGGTSATIGRYVRYRCHNTSLAVVDPEGSAFFDGWKNHDATVTSPAASRIEGIGRPRVEPSFLPAVIDRMIQVPDAGSVAAMLYLHSSIGRSVGPSTGTNLWGSLQIIAGMRSAGQSGSVVTLICDGGERYGELNSADGLKEAGIDPSKHLSMLKKFLAGEPWEPPTRVDAS